MEPTMKRQACSALAAILSGFCAAFTADAQPQLPNFETVEIHTLQVRDNVYMLVGAGGNITMQVGDDGILLVDTQYAPLS
jgi:cyclase